MGFLTLDAKGLTLAAILGVAMLFFGGLNLIFLVFMLYFLGLAAAVTTVGKERKKSLGVYQKARGITNVLSNGIGPLIFAFLFFIFIFVQRNAALAVASLAGFGASVAAITADKFSSELGVLNGAPHDILTYKLVKRGASGGVTVFGLASGLFGAMLISTPFTFIAFKLGYILPGNYQLAVLALLGCTAGGFAGTVVDSFLGHYEERGMGDKFTSNLACGLIGGIIGMLVLILI